MGYFTENQEIGKLLLDYGNKHSNIRCLVLGYFSMAFSYSVAGNFSLAIESCKQAVKVSEDPFYSMFPKPLMALNYVQIGDFKEAEKIANEVFSFCRKYGCEYQGTYASLILAFVMIANGKMATGLKQLKDILQRIKETEHKGFLPTGEYILGKIYFQISTGEGPISLSTIIKNAGFLLKTIPFASKRAEFHFNKAIETASEIGAKGVLAQAYLDLGLLHKAKKRKLQAKKCISDAVQLFEQCKADGYLKQANDALEFLQ
jgi:tetratricopeptide (TPR) repeat protein